jgi:phosphatidylglycerophosphatase A
MRPTFRFLFSHPAHLIAIGFGSGMPPWAPGTFGTLFGWATFVMMAPHLTTTGWTIVLVAGFALGCRVCERTGRDLGVADAGCMVWDEIIAIWLVLAVLGSDSLLWQAVGFGVFRFFDIVKPTPIRHFERRFKSDGWAGFGVMGDDLIAAFYSLLTMAVALRAVDWISGPR